MPYFRCGGGGGVTPFAFLIVNYPSTASVSATNTSGGKDLATGKKLFFVTGAGDCSVTISQPGKTPKTTTVNFGAGEEGYSKTVTINFSLSLIENGVIANDVLTAWKYYGQTGFGWIAWNSTYNSQKNDGNLTVASNHASIYYYGSAGARTVYYYLPVDSTKLSRLEGGYTKIYVRAKRDTSKLINAYFGFMNRSKTGTYGSDKMLVDISKEGYGINCPAGTHDTEDIVYSADINGGLSTSTEFSFFMTGDSAGECNLLIKDIWLE